MRRDKKLAGTVLYSIIENMAINDQLLPSLINAPDFDPEQMGASFWYEAYRSQKSRKGRPRSQTGSGRERVRAAKKNALKTNQEF